LRQVAPRAKPIQLHADRVTETEPLENGDSLVPSSGSRHLGIGESGYLGAASVADVTDDDRIHGAPLTSSFRAAVLALV
jgi:hypothetical protein